MRASSAELTTFASTIQGAIDHAGGPHTNTGRMWAPPGADNWRTVAFEAPAPLLDPELQPHAPFEPNEPISVSIEHSFGTTLDRITLRAHPKGELQFDGDRGRELYTSWWPSPNGDEDYFTVQGRPINTDIDLLGFTRFADQLIGEKVPDLPGLIEFMGVRDAFTLAVLKLRDRTDLTEKATRVAATRSAQNSASVNGMELNLSMLTCEEGASVYSIATAALRLGFRGEAYGGLYRGVVHKAVNVTCDRTGAPLEAERSSRIALLNDPFPRGQTNVILGTDLASRQVPEPLQHLLYPNNDVTAADLEYFTRLATKPWNDQDIEIEPPVIQQ